jgi:hypothetical protein
VLQWPLLPRERLRGRDPVTMRPRRPKNEAGAIRGVVVGLTASVLMIACGASTDTRDSKLGSGPDACSATESRCSRDNDCCSLWCVSGTCTRREP